MGGNFRGGKGVKRRAGTKKHGKKEKTAILEKRITILKSYQESAGGILRSVPVFFYYPAK